MTTRVTRRPIVLKSAIAAVIVVAVVPYLFAPIYLFPGPRAFRGPALWNPYRREPGTWLRANLHAHSRGWGTPADGRQSDAEIKQWYKSMGYSAVGLANHQRISDDPLPIYEQGYSLGKRHLLVIGARRVDWFDIPFWQFPSHKQFMIDRLRSSGELIAIAHPSERRAYTADDLRALTGYHLLEVVNGDSRAANLWDAALSSGRLVWGIGVDDTHDVMNARRTATGWTMIGAASTATSDVLAGLRAGRMYAVAGHEGRSSTVLSSVTVTNGTLFVTCEGKPATFSFVGQDGRLLKTVDETLIAKYRISAEDTYVRTVIQAPDAVLYLNPIVRYDGVRLHAPATQVDGWATRVARLALVTGCGLLLMLVTRCQR